MSDFDPIQRQRTTMSNPEGVPQADPALGLSHHHRAGGWQIGFVLVAAFLIIAVTIYGLNRPSSENQAAGTPSSQQQTTGAAQSGTASQAPAKMPGESGDPKANQAGGTPQQQVPDQGKPTTDSSQR